MSLSNRTQTVKRYRGTLSHGRIEIRRCGEGNAAYFEVMARGAQFDERPAGHPAFRYTNSPLSFQIFGEWEMSELAAALADFVKPSSGAVQLETLETLTKICP